ncbi:Pyruvate/Phosphoenolpyruvate kinase-like domain-containing protein [Armillaria fumosa]|nr:Pyruvate/Phosphoenolpyruvate kinase-like domain-containing protein [Armillaria fumosa]
MTTHALRKSFKSNKTAFGTWISLPGYFHARTVAQASTRLSWVMIDCEHGQVPLHPGVAESVAAIQSIGNGAPSALVRVPATEISSSTSWQIKYALDAGARGVLVPMVSSAEKAKEVVMDSRFPPAGRRGFGNPFTHGTWGVTIPQYLESANEEITVMVQIETKEGVENMKDIAAVDGIDALFIGPYDLSISLGYPPPLPDPHPNVEKVIKEILRVAHSEGKKCAIYCTSGEQAAKRSQEGFDMINVITDVGAISDSISHHLQTASAGKD